MSEFWEIVDPDYGKAQELHRFLEHLYAKDRAERELPPEDATEPPADQWGEWILTPLEERRPDYCDFLARLRKCEMGYTIMFKEFQQSQVVDTKNFHGQVAAYERRTSERAALTPFFTSPATTFPEARAAYLAALAEAA